MIIQEKNGELQSRFNVAKTLTLVGPKLPSAVMNSQVKPVLTKLNEDTDFDVRFFASEADQAIACAS